MANTTSVVIEYPNEHDFNDLRWADVEEMRFGIVYVNAIRVHTNS